MAPHNLPSRSATTANEVYQRVPATPRARGKESNNSRCVQREKDRTFTLYTTRFSLSMEMSRLTRDGTAEPVSRDQILRHARGQGNINFPCSADHEQDWQPYPVDPYSAVCNALYTFKALYTRWLCVAHLF